MPLHETSQELVVHPFNSPSVRSVGEPITTDAAEFRLRHGDPASWTAEEYDAYLDLTGRPSTRQGTATL
jgi:hypothetical protein